MEFRVDEPEPYIPDHLSIPQFVFDTTIVPRPQRPRETPCFIDEATGRGVFEAEAKHRSYTLAKALKLKWNIGKDDVVCIFSPNDVDYAVAVWAVHLTDAIVTPGNPGYTVNELAHQIKLTKSVLVIAHQASQKTVLAAAQASGLPDSRIAFFKDSPYAHVPTIDSLIAFGEASTERFEETQFSGGEARDALAFLSLSSGTTGMYLYRSSEQEPHLTQFSRFDMSQAVAISHFAVIANIMQTVAHWRINDPSWSNKFMCPGDIALGVLPFFHIYGLVVNLHFQLFCGMSIVVVPKFSFTRFLESIARYHVTNLYLVPSQIVLLCKQEATKKYDFSHVKFCMSGAAPLSGELCASLRQILPNAVIGQGYGLTETVASVCLIPPEAKDVTVGSAGRLLPGIKARVMKPDGTLADEGERGELLVTGPSMASYYLDNPMATKETFVDFWVRTGDEVIFRNNEIFVVDRVKEFLKVKGFQVTPAELEGHLLLHPDIVDSCVVSIPDEYSGELPLAYVVLQSHATARIKNNPKAVQEMKTAIFKHVADAKVQYKWLTGGIEFIDAIPRNPSGKIVS
ncbi:4-coumarate--CoA ligase-like 7 [Leucoagaricus sp. SymC.cos]|nr:4-coumarate--CoA ligase-like 7 [Leucoagaricus sp. SymC.cos]